MRQALADGAGAAWGRTGRQQGAPLFQPHWAATF